MKNGREELSISAPPPKPFDRMVSLFLSLTLPTFPPLVFLPPTKNNHSARAPQGRGMASVMNFYTDDSPGIKMSPVSALVFHFFFPD